MTDVLTDKQEAFAVAYVQTANAAESYRQAYSVDPESRDSWIYVEAVQLLDHPKIAPRIAELRTQAALAGNYTISAALDELEDARVAAKTEGQIGAAVSAINGKIKLLGLEAPRRQEIDHKNTDGSFSTIDVGKLTTEQKLALLAARVTDEPDPNED